MKYKIVIPSLGRPDVAAKHPLLSRAILAVHKDEEAQYRRTCSKALGIVAYPPEFIGLPKTRNWIVDNVREANDDFMVQVDDDLDYVRFDMGFKLPFYRDPDKLEAILRHTARLALDAGTGLFGYSHAFNPRERVANNAFRFRSWIGGVIGLVDPDLRFDPMCSLKEDVDICLETIVRYRFIVQDLRYVWMCAQWDMKGEASRFRTTASEMAALEYLRSKWGHGIVELASTRRKTGQVLKLHLS